MTNPAESTETLKRLVADQALDIQILKEVAKGEFKARRYGVGPSNTSQFSSLSRNDEHVALLANIEVCSEEKLLRTHIERVSQRACVHSNASICDAKVGAPNEHGGKHTKSGID